MEVEIPVEARRECAPRSDRNQQNVGEQDVPVSHLRLQPVHALWGHAERVETLARSLLVGK